LLHLLCRSGHAGEQDEARDQDCERQVEHPIADKQQDRRGNRARGERDGPNRREVAQVAGNLVTRAIEADPVLF